MDWGATGSGWLACPDASWRPGWTERSVTPGAFPGARLAAWLPPFGSPADRPRLSEAAVADSGCRFGRSVLDEIGSTYAPRMAEKAISCKPTVDCMDSIKVFLGVHGSAFRVGGSGSSRKPENSDVGGADRGDLRIPGLFFFVSFVAFCSSVFFTDGNEGNEVGG